VFLVRGAEETDGGYDDRCREVHHRRVIADEEIAARKAALLYSGSAAVVGTSALKASTIRSAGKARQNGLEISNSSAPPTSRSLVPSKHRRSPISASAKRMKRSIGQVLQIQCAPGPIATIGDVPLAISNAARVAAVDPDMGA
jgi:hypothetical protein